MPRTAPAAAPRPAARRAGGRRSRSARWRSVRSGRGRQLELAARPERRDQRRGRGACGHSGSSRARTSSTARRSGSQRRGRRPHLLLGDRGQPARQLVEQLGAAVLQLEHGDAPAPGRAPRRCRAAAGSRCGPGPGRARRRRGRRWRAGRAPRRPRRSTLSDGAAGGRCAWSSSAVGSRTSNGSPMKPDVAADAGHRCGRCCTSRSHQPGGVAVGEHLGQHHVRQVAGEVADRVRHPPGRGDRGQRGQRVGVRLAPLGGQVGLAEVGPHRRRPGRHVAEVPLDQRRSRRPTSRSPATASTALPAA